MRTLRYARNGLIRFKRLSVRRVISDLIRAARLHRTDASRPNGVERAERVVISLTTIPTRAGRLGPVLRSLADQSWPADEIILAWPRQSLRSGELYPDPPRLPDGVKVIRCEDQGPATKILCALREEPGSVVIVVDDDVIYPRDFVETLLKGHRARPKAALGMRGWRLDRNIDVRYLKHIFATALMHPREVDILLGTWGYLLPPRVLDDRVHDFEGWPEEVRWVDDVWISGHLARCGVPRLVLPARGLPIETRASGVDALTDGLNRSGDHDRVAIHAFDQWW